MPAAEKSSALIVKSQDPFNAEPPPERLLGSVVTPTPYFFVRNHGDIPELDAARHRLQLHGLVKRPLSLSLDDLRTSFRSYRVTAVLQCAGNRREELAAHTPIPGELPWGAGAVGAAEWTGVRLADVLGAAQLEERAEARPARFHVHLTGLDRVERQGRSFGFGGSIPLEKALQPEVLLAYEMNGEPLAPEHGHPLRLVAPGYIGARSVKWLGEVSVQDRPSENYFYARAYRLFPAWESAESVDWSGGIGLGEMVVNSVICLPAPGERLARGPLQVRGYALSGGGRRVERVDLSLDGGRTWQAARLGEAVGPWAWRFWSAEVELPAGEAELVSRAWDSAANSQPESIAQVWNFKGYMNNAWHRVRVMVEG